MKRAIALLLLLPAAAHATDALRPAAPLDRFPEAGGRRAGAVTVEELARLVDLDALATSPDGQQIAFHLRMPDPVANSVRTGWFRVPLGGGPPVPLGGGGDLELGQLPDGLVAGGIRAPIARWSPDGRWLAYSEVTAGRRGVRVIDVARGQGRSVVLDRDIRRFWWRSTDELGVAADTLTRAAADRSRAGERADGVAIAERFTPGASILPREPLSSADERYTIEAASGRVRPGATEPDEASGDADIRHSIAVPDGRLVARVADQRRAGVEAPLGLELRVGGQALVCPDPRCVGAISRLWWIGDEAVFQKRVGVNLQADAFYAWSPRRGRVRTIRAPDLAAFDLCAAASRALVCRLEAPTRPGRLVRLDLASGQVTELADPNPTLSADRFGQVIRVTWAARGGALRFGYLSLPPGRGLGPLVIVQYRARGFQRGGVGDEYPIAPLAAAGFAVLNVDRPNATDLFETIADPGKLYQAVLAREPADRRRLHAGLLAGIACVARLGLADTSRLGIGGLSDGAVSTYHAITNDRRFAAAIVSSPGWDPSAWFLASPDNRRQNAAAGLGDPSGPDAVRWRELSPARRAARITTPLLLNLADHELVLSAELLAALEAANVPHDAYVYEDEFHLKWQPAHRLSIYRRNLAWYRFWLLGGDAASQATASWAPLRRKAVPPVQSTMVAPARCQARSQASTAR